MQNDLILQKAMSYWWNFQGINVRKHGKWGSGRCWTINCVQRTCISNVNYRLQSAHARVVIRSHPPSVKHPPPRHGQRTNSGELHRWTVRAVRASYRQLQPRHRGSTPKGPRQRRGRGGTSRRGSQESLHNVRYNHTTSHTNKIVHSSG